MFQTLVFNMEYPNPPGGYTTSRSKKATLLLSAAHIFEKLAPLLVCVIQYNNRIENSAVSLKKEFIFLELPLFLVHVQGHTILFSHLL